ncbi:MAG: hypothetical protein H6598_05595 [Flavobacteriales bacterium]|nr:hypothetical protein [Flavobacteriales bacterium]
MRIILILVGFFIGLIGYSQINQEFKETEEGWTTTTYHENGKISSKIFRTKDPSYGAQGSAKVFNAKGELIYESPISHSAQIISVNFKFYENGAVKQINYSEHPDGGIQWYRKWIYLNDAGEVVKEDQQSWDDSIGL